VTVPNKIMGSAAITNLSKRQNIKTTINFALARDTSPEKIERAVALLKAIYGGNPMTEQAWVNFNQFAGANINVQVVHWWKGTDELKYLEGMQALNLAVKGRLETEGIKFA
ncbi:MAG TPA: hypothetical protein VHH88_05000, partial [Verrucomicrobiae bacterium]|nr:hypothetical protein [Verrucomicrobiae bacterium]